MHTATPLSVVLVLVLAPVSGAAPPATWEPRGVGGGGALFSPSFSPHAPDELYVACDMSELFHSTDLGASWTMLDFRTVQAFHEARVQFTPDPLVLYVIDYTTSAGIDYQAPSRSVDGGLSWSVLPGDPTGGDAWSLSVDPADADRVLVTDYNRLFFSSDGGTTFSEKFNDTSGNGCHVAGVLWDGPGIYVGTNAGVLVSTDGGASFSIPPAGRNPAGLAMTGFAGARSGGMTRLVGVFADAGGVYNGIQGWDHDGYRQVHVQDWGGPGWVCAPQGSAPGTIPSTPGWPAATSPRCGSPAAATASSRPSTARPTAGSPGRAFCG